MSNSGSVLVNSIGDGDNRGDTIISKVSPIYK